MKNIFNLCYILCITLLLSCSLSAGRYKEELDNYITKEKNTLKMKSDLRTLHNSIKICEEELTISRFYAFLFHCMGGVCVTEQDMPLLYKYIKDMCNNVQIKMPGIFIHPEQGFFNAMASKMFRATGIIIIGKELIDECTDEEIEAIVAHEIGHIKHNHVNKALLIQLSVFITYYYLFMRQDATGKALIHIEELNSPLGTYVHGSIAGDLARSIIGKRFECEADQFAFDQGKAHGIELFFKRMIERDQKYHADFQDLSGHMQEYKEKASLTDYYLYLLPIYYLARFNIVCHDVHQWLYHNTNYGPHPSHDKRIQAAQEYLAKNC